MIRRDLGDRRWSSKVSRILHASIAYALEHRDEALDYALQFGRGLDRKKADRFVGMYVNELTLGVRRSRQACGSKNGADEAFGERHPAQTGHRSEYAT